MKWEDIKKANETIKTMDVKGKQYAEVNQRIKAFRMLEPNGSITTEIISLENGICTIKATVSSEDGKVLGTGLAQEKENSSYINKTSYIENCETSAVGRALGMCGLGIDVSIASAEEVITAITNQAIDPKQKITAPKLAVLKKKYTGENLQKLLAAQGIEKLEDMTEAKATELISKLNKE